MCASQFHYEAVYFSNNYTDYVKSTTKSPTNEQTFVDVLQGTVSAFLMLLLLKSLKRFTCTMLCPYCL